ncbi:7-carboxy-7-deazaguanine synthase QueE [Caldalkalibacillus uzonensis]|nr:radical SAM protein [Caldalkalibacillus uzonensis]
MARFSVPMVEIFETVEGEGLRAGFPTVFVRVFHCNLRCVWCDTPYSYAPAKPEFEATVEEIVHKVKGFASRAICLTGGEPLIHGHKSAALIHGLSYVDSFEDIHIETNGAIDLQPFARIREQDPVWDKKVRFIMDYKLPASGEMERMIHSNFEYLRNGDEIKFVIGSDEDFECALKVMERYHRRGTVLMSPVWETMPPMKLVEKVLSHGLAHVKVNLQLHKIIWDPDQRGV